MAKCFFFVFWIHSALASIIADESFYALFRCIRKHLSAYFTLNESESHYDTHHDNAHHNVHYHDEYRNVIRIR